MKNQKRNPKEDRQDNWISIRFELAGGLARSPIHQHVPDIESGLPSDERFAIYDDSFTFRACHDGWQTYVCREEEYLYLYSRSVLLPEMKVCVVSTYSTCINC